MIMGRVLFFGRMPPVGILCTHNYTVQRCDDHIILSFYNSYNIQTTYQFQSTRRSSMACNQQKIAETYVKPILLGIRAAVCLVGTRRSFTTGGEEYQ